MPPPKFVCRFHTGEAFLSPPIRRVAAARSSRRPSVRYVRRKNSTGSTYSRDPSPLDTQYRSAANSAPRIFPSRTSLCGVITSRHGLSPCPSTPVTTCTARRVSALNAAACASRRSFRTASASAVASTADSSRSIVSSARYVSSALNGSLCASRFPVSRSSEANDCSARDSDLPNTRHSSVTTFSRNRGSCREYLCARPVLGVVPRFQHGDPVLPSGRLRRHRRVNERQQPRLQQLQPRVDPLPVTRRHRRHSRSPA